VNYFTGTNAVKFVSTVTWSFQVPLLTQLFFELCNTVQRKILTAKNKSKGKLSFINLLKHLVLNDALAYDRLKGHMIDNDLHVLVESVLQGYHEY